MSAIIRLRFYPAGKARDLLRSRDRELLAVGPAGCGKTRAILEKIHLACRKYPGIRVLMLRKVGEDLRTGALKTYLEQVRPDLDGVRPYGGSPFSPAEFRYPNGSTIVPTGLDKSDKVLSAEYDIIFVNEATQISEYDWTNLRARGRNFVMPYQQLIGDCNPSGARHWLNRRCNNPLVKSLTMGGAEFITEQPPDPDDPSWPRQTVRMKFTHQDNPAYWNQKTQTWTPQGEQYVLGDLGSLTGAQRKRLLEGVWASQEGLVYEFENFMEKRNADIDLTGWRPYMGVDVGSRNPTAIVSAYVSGDERMHVSNVFYRRNMNAREITDAIRTQADILDPVSIFVDPSAKMIIDELVQDGYPVIAADNRIEEGIRQVQAVMQRGFSIDPDHGADLIEEFGMYAYPANAKIETDKPVKDFDHAADAVRYLCQGAFEPVFDLAAFYGGASYA